MSCRARDGRISYQRKNISVDAGRSDASKKAEMEEVTHVFWPSTLGSGAGKLVGWQCGSIVCVATLVSYEEEGYEETVARLPSTMRTPRILGSLADAKGKASTWTDEPTFTLVDSLPFLETSTADPVMIIYRPPSLSSHHFFSLSPLLDALAPLDEEERLEQERSAVVAERMRMLTAEGQGKRKGKGEEKEDVMQTVIECLNQAQELHDALHSVSPPKSSTAPPRSAASKSGNGVVDHPLFLSLLARSAFAQQVFLRVTQVSTWPVKYRLIWRDTSNPISSRRAQYVRLFSTLWLIANDISVGYSLSSLLRSPSSASLSTSLITFLHRYTVELPIGWLRWTNEYPVGLKLNDELGRAFCEGSVRAIALWWQHALLPLSTHLPTLLYALGLASSLGATFTLAASSDLLALSTLHLWVVYRVMTFVFRWHLRVLGVLFDIFRGKKWNVLRGRREPATYELDQLILGTIFFTLATFLFPTALAFYLLCGAGRLAIIAVQAAIETGLALLNHFPLFAVLLRLKDPRRLPAGIRFRPLSPERPDILKLESVPVDMGWIFADYVALARKLMAHYSPLHLLAQLLCGTAIQPLARHDLRTA